jgi:hypothetical protein
LDTLLLVGYKQHVHYVAFIVQTFLSSLKNYIFFNFWVVCRHVLYLDCFLRFNLFISF